MTTALTTQPLLRLRTPDDILAGTPYLLGFHPSDSLVVLGVRGLRLRFHMRGDLPTDQRDVEALAEEYGAMFAAQGVDAVVLLGYGPPELAVPSILAALDAMQRRNIEVRDMLWVHAGRYRSLMCRSTECCPEEGRPFDVTTSAIAATATVNGMVALPDRQTIVSSLAPPTGDALTAADDAADLAAARLNRIPTPITDGAPTVDEAVERYRAGGRFSDDEAARFTLVLHHLPMRDEAWLRIDHDGTVGRETHNRLWTDLVRRCSPAIVAPPAMLLAYACWRAGDGVRARIAVDRALDADPGYSGAKLMAEILNKGLSPRSLPPVSESGRRPRRRAARRRRR